MAHATRVAVVAAQDLVRNGLEALFNRKPGEFAVVGTYRDLEAAENVLRNEEIDVLLLDDSLPPSASMLDRVEQLRSRFPQLALLILSDRLNRRYVQLLFAAGAVGFVCPDDFLEETLLPGIHTVMQGYYYTSPRASGLMANGRAAALPGKLNNTDLEVLELIGAGMTLKDIARVMEIRVRSIYRIRHKLRVVLGAPTNEHIVDIARQQGLLSKRRPNAPKQND